MHFESAFDKGVGERDGCRPACFGAALEYLAYYFRLAGSKMLC